LDQLIGIAAVIISSFVLVERYGVPDTGTAFGYFLFGVLFVTLGVFIGKMLDASVLQLLLLAEWNLNISLMVIGYSTIIAALLGWGSRAFRMAEGDRKKNAQVECLGEGKGSNKKELH